MGDCDEDVGRAIRTGNDCSFEGGAGGSSRSETFELSLSGPSGPRESSMASNRVVCGPTFRDARGFLPAGDLGEEIAGTGGFCDFCDSGLEPAMFKRRVDISQVELEIPCCSDSTALGRLAIELEREGTSTDSQTRSFQVLCF